MVKIDSKWPCFEGISSVLWISPWSNISAEISTKDYDHLIPSFQKTQCFERGPWKYKLKPAKARNSMKKTVNSQRFRMNLRIKQYIQNLWRDASVQRVSEWQTYKCQSGRRVCSFGPCFRRWQRVRRWPQKAIIGPAWATIPQKGTGIESNHSWLSGRKNLPSFQSILGGYF